MIDALRFAWIAITVVAAVLTIGAVVEARRDTVILRQFNGSVRGIVARATLRRETFRLGSQVSMLIVAMPFPQWLRLTAAMCIPIFIFLNTVSDRTTRQTLLHKSEAEIVAERATSLSQMEERLNARADERAETAGDEADERAGIVRAKADDLQAVADSTASQVSDLHEGTAPEARS